MFKGFFLLAFSFFISHSGFAVDGEITNFTLNVNFGASPGADKFDVSGNYILGAGSNGILPPGEAVFLSFDGGRFVQAIPAYAFVPINGGYKYASINPGITLFKIMNNGTFSVQVKNIDLTGEDSTKLQAFSFSVGDDAFSLVPNSLPVAHISAPTAAIVGEEILLDGSASTDFNPGTVLSYTWSIVSAPEGSTAQLTNANQAQTNFMADKNGYYVFKLIVNDGITDGISSLVTIRVSGGVMDPPPAPSPDNGFINLSLNQQNYIVGEMATLLLHINVLPNNGNDEYFFQAMLDAEPINLTNISDTDYSYTSTAFSSPGSHAFSVALYIQNRNLAKQLTNSINFYQKEIIKIDLALVNETDPDIIASLQTQRAEYQLEISKAEEELEKNRTKVGATPTISFAVNP